MMWVDLAESPYGVQWSPYGIWGGQTRPLIVYLTIIHTGLLDSMGRVAGHVVEGMLLCGLEQGTTTTQLITYTRVMRGTKGGYLEVDEVVGVVFQDTVVGVGGVGVGGVGMDKEVDINVCNKGFWNLECNIRLFIYE